MSRQILRRSSTGNSGNRWNSVRWTWAKNSWFVSGSSKVRMVLAVNARRSIRLMTIGLDELIGFGVFCRKLWYKQTLNVLGV
jgi:hypothetical protein